MGADTNELGESLMRVSRALCRASWCKRCIRRKVRQSAGDGGRGGSAFPGLRYERDVRGDRGRLASSSPSRELDREIAPLNT